MTRLRPGLSPNAFLTRRAFVGLALALFAVLLVGCGQPRSVPPPSSTVNGATSARTLVPSTIAPAQTPTPDGLLLGRKAGDAARIGDMSAAISLWEQAVAWSPVNARSAANIELARAYLEENRRPEAAQALVKAFEDAQDDAQRLEALGMLGSLYESLSAWQGAADIYARYLSIGGDAEPYVRFRRAIDLKALGNDALSQGELERIDLGDLPAAKRAEILEELAGARARQGDVAGAAQAYTEILAFAQTSEYRALVEQELAQLLGDSGRTEDARLVFRRIIAEYPESKAASLALKALDDLGGSDLNGLEKGRVFLAAGDAAAAVASLQTYLAGTRPAGKPEALYLLGQAQTQLGDYAQAIKSLDAAATAFAALAKAERDKEAALLGDVRLAKAHAVAHTGADAATLYYSVWRDMPQYAHGADALYQAAFWAESELGWERAGAYYHAFAEAYPQDARADEARFREGLGAYDQKRYAEAVVAWTAEMSRLPASDVSRRARVLTWLGLATRAQGDEASAQGYWSQAQAEAPESYYGLRARDLRSGVGPTLGEPSVVDVPPAPTLADWDAVSGWVSTWYTATPPLTDTLKVRGITRRGEALMAIGWHRDADEAFGQALQAVKDSPPRLVELMIRLYEGESYPYAISAAERLIYLGREAKATSPPAAVWRVAYPLVYGDLVQQQGIEQGVDPLLFLALVRQESRFYRRAVSYAGATGLTQVMPATGTWIAERLGVSGFAPSLLTRPVVSVRFGVWYLGTLLGDNGRDWVASLVGYNAGPGNLQRWTNGQPVVDHDLFYETLPNQQPKDYVRLIYEGYRAYQRIYAQTGSPSVQGESP